MHTTNIQENTQVSVSAWKRRYVGETKYSGKIYKITLCSANCILNMNYPGKSWLTPPIPMSIFCWFIINDWKEMGDRIICNINRYSSQLVHTASLSFMMQCIKTRTWSQYLQTSSKVSSTLLLCYQIRMTTSYTEANVLVSVTKYHFAEYHVVIESELVVLMSRGLGNLPVQFD